MIPIPPWELMGGLLAGMATLITAIIGGAKMLAEIRSLKAQAHASAKSTAEAIARQSDGWGPTAREELRSVLELSRHNTDMISSVAQAQRRIDSELSRVNRHLTSIGERITLETSHTSTRLDDLSERIREAEKIVAKRIS